MGIITMHVICDTLADFGINDTLHGDSDQYLAWKWQCCVMSITQHSIYIYIYIYLYLYLYTYTHIYTLIVQHLFVMLSIKQLHV